MGWGDWSASTFSLYSVTKGRGVSTDGVVTKGMSTSQDTFKAHRIDPALDPKNVVRECRDSEDHPNTVPVILALDVTGSMGQSAVEVAKKLNVIMTKLFEEVKDVEFLTMGIGDLAYDDAPIQASQFESDVRIAEQLDKLYFEGGGGGNAYESYSSAWYFGLNHTDLDCWKRGKKGIIITIGDELLNPYLPINGTCGGAGLRRSTGDELQADVETSELYGQASEKFDIYHLHVVHGNWSEFRKDEVRKTFLQFLPENHYRDVSLDGISDAIIDIVVATARDIPATAAHDNVITW